VRTNRRRSCSCSRKAWHFQPWTHRPRTTCHRRPGAGRCRRGARRCAELGPGVGHSRFHRRRCLNMADCTSLAQAWSSPGAAVACGPVRPARCGLDVQRPHQAIDQSAQPDAGIAVMIAVSAMACQYAASPGFAESGLDGGHDRQSDQCHSDGDGDPVEARVGHGGRCQTIDRFARLGGRFPHRLPRGGRRRLRSRRLGLVAAACAGNGRGGAVLTRAALSARPMTVDVSEDPELPAR
jgi:hypothetical protein